jgi:hypothetical protein
MRARCLWEWTTVQLHKTTRQTPAREQFSNSDSHIWQLFYMLLRPSASLLHTAAAYATEWHVRSDHQRKLGADRSNVGKVIVRSAREWSC